jgi:hypothetical protein
MNLLLRNSMFAAALSLGLAFSGTAMAQVKPPPCDPNKEVCEPPPKDGTPCSPGFYKNHIDFWWGIYCDIGSGQCATLLTALTCKGADATCGRSDAAAYLNAQSGCTE